MSCKLSNNIIINLILMICIFNIGASWAGEILIHTPRGRPAQELVNVLQPLLRPDESVSSIGSQLLIRASETRQADILQLLQQIDTVPRQLRITVSNTRQLEGSNRQLAVGGQIEAGNARIGVTPPSQPNIVVQNGSSVIAAQAQQQQRQQQNSDVQVLTVMEGYPALLRTGESRALPQQTLIRQGDRLVLLNSQQYVSADSGMRVIPRLQGDRVFLQIVPQQASFTVGSARQITQAATTITGRLGEWMELGGISQSSNSDSSGILSSAGGQQSQETSIWVKVELIPQ